MFCRYIFSIIQTIIFVRVGAAREFWPHLGLFICPTQKKSPKIPQRKIHWKIFFGHICEHFCAIRWRQRSLPFYSSSKKTSTNQNINWENILNKSLWSHFLFSRGEHLCESRCRRGSIRSPADNRNVRRCNSKLITTFLTIFWLWIYSSFAKNRQQILNFCYY